MAWTTIVCGTKSQHLALPLFFERNISIGFLDFFFVKVINNNINTEDEATGVRKRTACTHMETIFPIPLQLGLNSPRE
jgi:hypothetical protein